jgi:hypothetical protein
VWQQVWQQRRVPLLLLQVLADPYWGLVVG